MITFLRSAGNRGWSDRRLLSTLLLFRYFNALLIQTSYVPDEYWQCLEVAHRLAFGYGYLTWEWKEGIRGYTYPLTFAVVYKTLENLHIDFRYTLVVVPKFMQATLGAVGDLFVYKLAWKLFGQPGPSFWALLCHLSSWFIFYTWPRTLTNSTEAILTTVALYYYPWWLLVPSNDSTQKERSGKKFTPERKYLLYAALACTVRSTSAIIWAPLCVLHLQHTQHKAATILRAFVPTAVCALGASMFIDSIFYGKFTNVHYNFLRVNFLSNVASFYGTNPWHWYLSNGLPTVLGPQLMPCLIGAWHCRAYKHHRVLLSVILWTLIVFSYLSHKEHRFLLPLLPPLMCYGGSWLHNLSGGETAATLVRRPRHQRHAEPSGEWKATVATVAIAAINVLIMLYTALLHQRGVLDVTRYLSQQAAAHPSETHVVFLMPCHSTPLYSHVHHDVPLRFLTCEPDIHDTKILDEAGLFHTSPAAFLQHNLTLHSTRPVSHYVMFNSMQTHVELHLKSLGFEK